MSFMRLRRLRRTQNLRDLVGKVNISVRDLIMPYFTIEGRNNKEPIESMPGVYRLSLDNLIKDVQETKSLGIKAILLFGICGKKDERGSGAFSKEGIAQKAIRALRGTVKDIIIISDACLCGYTTHGHCGILRSDRGPVIDNDETLKILSKIALSHAQAGADFVAPSAMADGQVKAIREILDKHKFYQTGILAYSAKYASSFYGPFREAYDSHPQFGDRRSYQMDYRNSNEALREIKQDIDEGADIVMVKPALAYLDIIYRAKQSFHIPVAAYNVSGEYSLIKAGAQKGFVDEKKIIPEILTSIKRAGADLIITYHAKEVAQCLIADRSRKGEAR